ncbi:MAG: PH domain-containing protein [Pirellulales bacterium]
MTERLDPRQITRPDPSLMKYYGIIALLTGPVFPITILPLFFKYETLKYRFDDEGVSMSWGILFKREIYLTYRRIQDIHLTRNILQRWMGLATVSIQTASGSSAPEMSIEGIREADALRDYLYAKMRGARGEQGESAAGVAVGQEGAAAQPVDEPLELLCEIRDALVQLAGRREAGG